jgi:toxin secretion/phage lysis holin
MKLVLCLSLGVFGAGVAGMFGGWDAALSTLLLFMAADYVTGLVVAGVFRRSPKSESGALESRAGLKGLLRKGGMLLAVLVACRLDLSAGSHYVRDGAVIAFIVNETLSLTENLGLMGVPIPKTLAEALEALKRKSGDPKE